MRGQFAYEVGGFAPKRIGRALLSRSRRNRRSDTMLHPACDGGAVILDTKAGRLCLAMREAARVPIMSPALGD